jgi:hypothetical protein
MSRKDSSPRRRVRILPRRPQTPEEHLEQAHLDRLSSQAATAQADLQRARIGIHSIPRDEHTRIRLRARSMLRTLPSPRLAAGKDEVEED